MSRTELPPLPSDMGGGTPSRDDATVDIQDVIDDLNKRLKTLEWVLGQMTVNNATRAVLWNGPVNSQGHTHTVVAGGAMGSGVPSVNHNGYQNYANQYASQTFSTSSMTSTTGHRY